MRNNNPPLVKLTKQDKLTPAIELNYSKIRKSVLILRAVNHHLRRRILDFLQDSESPTTIDTIYQHLRLEQSVALMHLSILIRANVVVCQKNDRNRLVYYLDEVQYAKIVRIVHELANP